MSTMKTKKTINFTKLVFFSALLVMACGKDDASEDKGTEDGSSGGAVTSPGGGTSSTESSGTVTMGAVSGAVISVYELNDDGTRGVLIESTVSGSDGTYALKVEHAAPVEVVSVGGSYTDEATGETVDLGTSEIRTWAASRISGEHIGVNALTTIAASRASENAAQGLATAIAAANGEVADLFGLSGVDIVATKPDDLTDARKPVDETTDTAKLGLAMSTVSQMAKDNGLAADKLGDLVKALAEDYADGTFDGKSGEKDLSVALSVTPDAAMNGLSTAMANFVKGPQNKAGFSADSLPAVPAHKSAP